MSASAMALAATLALAAAPQAAVVTNPDWVTKPSGADIASHYPKMMIVLGIEGRATIHCDVTVQGDAANCVVRSESPTGLGFGPAAVSLAPTFKFSPKKLNGRPMDGGSVNIPITFSLDRSSPPPSFSSMPHYATDPKSKALAHRLAELINQHRFEPGSFSQLEAIAAKLPNEGNFGSRQRMVKAYEEAIAAYEPAVVEQAAVLCAELFTTKQMEDAVAFLESDSGQALWTNLSVINPQMTKFVTDQHTTIAAAAMKIYCAEPGACSATEGKPVGGRGIAGRP